MSIGEAAVLIFSIITVMGSLVIILRALLSPIKEQVYNHLPTQIKDLKDNVKDLKDGQKEMRDDIKKLSHLPTEVKSLKDNQKEMRKEIREDIKALNQKVDQNFKEIFGLLSKSRAS